MGMGSLLPDVVKEILMGLTAGILVLSWAAPKYPHVTWLQKFHLRDPRSDVQKQRARRSGNIMAGLQLIGMGLLIPLGYLVITAMFFSEITTTELLIVGTASLLCIMGGITAIVKARSA